MRNFHSSVMIQGNRIIFRAKRFCCWIFFLCCFCGAVNFIGEEAEIWRTPYFKAWVKTVEFFFVIRMNWPFNSRFCVWTQYHCECSREVWLISVQRVEVDEWQMFGFHQIYSLITSIVLLNECMRNIVMQRYLFIACVCILWLWLWGLFQCGSFVELWATVSLSLLPTCL